jgi:ubiquinone/menaquinone biosynthesis C-methylase UbiE
MTDALLDEAALLPDSLVLDLAAGSGEPALSIAPRLTTGKVIALDSSRNGLVLAREHAEQLGSESRIACLQADAHAIPLALHTIDSITCRCGIMFFDDCEMRASAMFANSY